MNRRDFLKGLTAVTAVAMVPFKWIKEHTPWGFSRVAEIRYYDRRLTNAEIKQMSEGVFPDD